jgi:hypothetical protein
MNIDTLAVNERLSGRRKIEQENVAPGGLRAA